MQAIPAVQLIRRDVPPVIALLDPSQIDFMEWKGRRIEILGTTDDARFVVELDDETDLLPLLRSSTPDLNSTT